MAQVTIKTQRLDPYKNFKFRLKWRGKTVAGVSKVNGLKRTTNVLKQREASRSRKLPGGTKYEPITLERGVTHDSEFARWASSVCSLAGQQAKAALKTSLRDVIIEQYNEAGQLAITYKVFRCWVSEFQALPDLDAGANAVAIEHIKLENEGWQRD
ncbi:MAG TPA: phage tail protein [Candidatus Angelobacter sp.]